MNKNNYLPKRFMRYVSGGVVMSLAVLLLSSCLKSKDNYQPVISDVMIVNADPNTPSAYFLYGGQQVDLELRYGQSSSYYSLDSRFGMEFYRGTSTSGLLAAGPVPGVAGNYSVYLTGQGKDSCFVVEDKLKAPATNSVAIRFINASKSTGDVDVTIGSAESKLSGVKFGLTSGANPEFKEYPVSGPATTVTVYAAGSTTSPLVTRDLSLTPGKSYTVFLSGVKTGTGDKQLQLGVADHTAAQ